jgi:hypothetical protein
MSILAIKLKDKIDYLVDTLINTNQKKIMIDAEDIKNQEKIYFICA